MSWSIAANWDCIWSQPFQVALAGPPNVGKSSLINALVGYERAIVFDAPGTTRDVVTAETAIDGWPLALSDTAGLCDGTDPLEDLRRAKCAGTTRNGRPGGARGRCESVPESDDRRLRTAYPGALVAMNKCDLAPPFDVSGERTVLRTSAVTGEGIADLLRTIGRRLVRDPPPARRRCPLPAAQVHAVRQALSAVERRDFTLAAAMLAPLLQGRQGSNHDLP